MSITLEWNVNKGKEWKPNELCLLENGTMLYPYEACFSVRNPPVITWFPVPSSKHNVKWITAFNLSTSSRFSPQTGQVLISDSLHKVVRILQNTPTEETKQGQTVFVFTSSRKCLDYMNWIDLSRYLKQPLYHLKPPKLNPYFSWRTANRSANSSTLTAPSPFLSASLKSCSF